MKKGGRANVSTFSFLKNIPRSGIRGWTTMSKDKDKDNSNIFTIDEIITSLNQKRIYVKKTLSRQELLNRLNSQSLTKVYN